MAAITELWVVWTQDGRALAARSMVHVPVWDDQKMAGHVVKLTLGAEPDTTVVEEAGHG